MKKANLANLILAAGIALSSAGCASTYAPDNFRFPERVECNKITRYVPGDKIINIPKAVGIGLEGTCDAIKYHTKRNGIFASPITIPINLAFGLLNTTLDTAVNTISWIPLEIYEGVTGKTWKDPYMPNINCLNCATGYEDRMKELDRRIEENDKEIERLQRLQRLQRQNIPYYLK